MGWTPRAIPDCKLWLAADAITGLSDGDPVAVWPEQGVMGFDVIQSDLTRQPTWRAGVLNGLPVVRFDGTNDYFNTNQVGPGGDGITVFQVSKSATAAGYRSLVRFQSEVNGYWVSNWKTGSIGLTYQIASNSGGTLDRVSTGMTENNWQIGVGVHARNSATGRRTYRNGSLVASASSTDTPLVDGHMLLIGSYQGTGEFTEGDRAEIIGYGFALSDGDRQKVEGYLAHKWGLVGLLPVNHPYKDEPPSADDDTGPALSSPHLINQFDPSQLLSSPHLLGSFP